MKKLSIKDITVGKKKNKKLSIKDIYFEITLGKKTFKLPIADTPRNRKMYGIPLKKSKKSKKSKKD